MIKLLLESEGIYCFLKDEHLVTTAPFFANISGGVKLQVRAEDVEHAIELLREKGYIREDLKTPQEKRKENLILIVLLAIAAIALLLLSL